MSKLSDLKNGLDDRAKVTAWCDFESPTKMRYTDSEKDFVIEQCKELTDGDRGARTMYVMLYHRDCAQ